MRVLIVDDEKGLRSSLFELLKDRFETETAEDGAQALKLITEKSFELILSDLRMPNLNGLELLAKVKEISPLTSFILMTAQGSIDGAVSAIQAGADDYISKPIEFTELLHRIERIIDLRAWQARKNLQQDENKKTIIIGQSGFISDVKKFVVQVAQVQSPVLLLGPSGTGKEVVARSIHESAHNRDQAFVAINCASLSEQLIESELFGHEKGAFTGATSSKPGKFELAAGGTIFLDEIGEIPLSLQAKLLRVLQEKEFCRVGGTRQIKSQARVIAATHRNLKDWVHRGLFREDLYFRLNVLQYEMIPLSQRQDDVPILINYYWNLLSEELAIKSSLAPAAKKILENYDYPGNVRELKNIIERLIVLTPSSGHVDVANLPKDLIVNDMSNENPGASLNSDVKLSEIKVEKDEYLPPKWKPGVSLEPYLENIEEQIIQLALTISDHNQVQTSELLGIHRSTLQYKIKKSDPAKKKAS